MIEGAVEKLVASEMVLLGYLPHLRAYRIQVTWLEHKQPSLLYLPEIYILPYAIAGCSPFSKPSQTDLPTQDTRRREEEGPPSKSQLLPEAGVKGQREVPLPQDCLLDYDTLVESRALAVALSRRSEGMVIKRSRSQKRGRKA